MKLARSAGGDLRCTALCARGCRVEFCLLEMIRCVLLWMLEAVEVEFCFPL